MNSSGKALKPDKPVMLCRLCHCDFTNFKEHVKSLVHLDARETKTTTTPLSKHKSTNDNRGESSKRARVDVKDDKSDASYETDHKDESSASKKILSAGDQPYSPTLANDEDSNSSFQEEYDAYVVDLNGSAYVNKDQKRLEEEVPQSLPNAHELEDFAKANDIELTPAQKSFLFTTWRCELCTHIHHSKDESFDKHAESDFHKKLMERHINAMKTEFKCRTSCQWLMNCLACSFFTNDKDMYISHLRSEQHDKNYSEIIGGLKDSPGFPKYCTCMRSDANKHSASKTSDQKPSQDAPVNCTKPNMPDTKQATSQEDKNAAKDPFCRKVTSAKALPKKNFPQPVVEKSQANSNTRGNGTQRSLGKSTRTPTVPTSKQTPNICKKSKPTPLMSLSVKPLVKKEPAWMPPTPVRPSSNQPGLLGEYRPPPARSNFGIESLQQDDPFESLTHSSVIPPSLGIGLGRPAYAEANRDFQRNYDSDSYGSVLGSKMFDTIWSGQNCTPRPTEKLNSLAFGRVEPSPPPASDFDTLAKLFTQQPGCLPSNVSLDLATNSSIRYKFNSDRGAMFDNYPTLRSDMSRTDFSRNDMSRNHSSRDNVSRTDLLSRPMFSRR